MASFNVLQPGTRLIRHTSSDNQRIKLHCGILNPSNVSMKIANETLTWQPGACTLLDDSFEHWVVHKGPEDRVILDIVVEHPDIKAKIKKHSRLGPVNDPSWIGFWGPGAGEAARSEL